MNSHPDCAKCNTERRNALMDDLKADGLTFVWTTRGETRRVKRWFNRGYKTQQKEFKIGIAPNFPPHGVYRWKTIKVEK
jgi:hypothetical protein